MLGWLTKLALLLAVLGLIAFDMIALATTGVTAADDATTDASLAADTYKATTNPQKAYDTAAIEALKHNETIDPNSFYVTPDGHITLTVTRTATTLWMHRIGPLKKYTILTGTATASPPP